MGKSFCLSERSRLIETLLSVIPVVCKSRHPSFAASSELRRTDSISLISLSVGLGFRDLSAARSYSFPFTLFQQTGSKTFSMLLSRIPGKSRLTFGVDRNIIGSNPVFYPVAKDPDSSWRTFWQIGQCEYRTHSLLGRSLTINPPRQRPLSSTELKLGLVGTTSFSIQDLLSSS